MYHSTSQKCGTTEQDTCVMLSCVVGCVHVGVRLLSAHQEVELVSTRVAAEVVLIVQSSTVVELFVLEEANK